MRRYPHSRSASHARRPTGSKLLSATTNLQLDQPQVQRYELRFVHTTVYHGNRPPKPLTSDSRLPSSASDDLARPVDSPDSLPDDVGSCHVSQAAEGYRSSSSSWTTSVLDLFDLSPAPARAWIYPGLSRSHWAGISDFSATFGKQTRHQIRLVLAPGRSGATGIDVMTSMIQSDLCHFRH